jgi:hypothetical protein
MISGLGIIFVQLITANAYEGDGGNIHIVSEQLIKSGDSIISVSSALGIDGNIKVESPDIDINAGFIRLDESFLMHHNGFKRLVLIEQENQLANLLFN